LCGLYLGLCAATRGLELLLGILPDLVEPTPQFGNLRLRGTTYVIRVLLRRVAEMGQLYLRLATNLGRTGLGGFLHCPRPFFGGGPRKFLRETPKVRFEVRSGALQCPVECLSKVIVERHSLAHYTV
jgi:hypothetical protein